MKSYDDENLENEKEKASGDDNENEVIDNIAGEEISNQAPNLNEGENGEVSQEPIQAETVLGDGDSSGGAPILKIAIAVVAVLVFAGAVVFAFSGIFLSDKDLYLKLEGNNIKQIMGYVDDIKGSTLGELMEAAEGKYTYDFDMALNVEGANIPQDVKEKINKSTLSGKATYDMKADYEDLDLTYHYKDKQTTATMIKDKNILALIAPDLYGEELKVDLNNLEQIYKTLGIEDTEELPKRIGSNEEMLELYKLTKDEQKIVNKELKQYRKELKDMLKNAKYEKDKEAKFTYNSKKVECKAIKVTVSELELEKALKNILQQTKDGQSLEILLNKAKAINDYTGTSKTLPTKEELQESLQETIDSLDKSIEEITVGKSKSDNSISMKLFYNNKLETLKRDLIICSTDIETKEISNQTLELITIDKEDSKYYKATFPGNTVIEDIVTIENDITTHSIKLITIESNYELDENYNFITKETEKQNNYKILVDKTKENKTLITITTDTDKDFKMTFEIEAYSKGKNIVYNLIASIVAEDEKYELVYNNKIIRINKITKKEIPLNAVTVNEQSKEGLEKIEQDIKNNAIHLFEGWGLIKPQETNVLN